MASRKNDAIPVPVCAVVGDVLGSIGYSHSRLNVLFMEAGAPGEAPEGNRVDKCVEWLKRASQLHPKPLEVLGTVLCEFMEVEPPPPTNEFDTRNEEWLQGKNRIEKALSKHGLAYVQGGRVHSLTGSLPTQTFEQLLRSRDFGSTHEEFERALATATTDPGAAVTAACATLESLFKVYLTDEGVPLPTDQSVTPLWKAVQGHLGLSPASLQDDDLKKILSGLSSIVQGIGAFRTHAGSAHGAGRLRYRVEPRHARLTVNAAHSLATFLIETWDVRKQKLNG